MANYNTFVVINCKSRRPVLVTSSALKVERCLVPGLRVEVWNGNACVKTIYSKGREALGPYIKNEREYIGRKQAAAEARNKRRRGL